MHLPLRSGILTFSGRYLAAGSSRVTSLRLTMSANTSEVKTLVTDPILKIVSPSSVRGSPLARLPVWSKYSCGAAIVPEYAAQAFSTADATSPTGLKPNWGGEEQNVVFPLMDAVFHGAAQRAFPKQNEMGKAFALTEHTHSVSPSGAGSASRRLLEWSDCRSSSYRQIFQRFAARVRFAYSTKSNPSLI